MALTRLKNVFTSKTGRCLYVNFDDFDASDAFDTEVTLLTVLSRVFKGVN